MRRWCTLILWCLLTALCVSAFGCNTVEGMGQDLQKAGEAIQDTFE